MAYQRKLTIYAIFLHSKQQSTHQGTLRTQELTLIASQGPFIVQTDQFLGAKAPLEIASVSQSARPSQKNLQLQFLAMTWTNYDWYQIEWY